MKTLTVFTPTYNRAETLVRTYNSLCNQTCDDFEWLIIDDGSTDGTENIVKPWLSEAPFKVRYIQKENGGLHTGYTIAIANIYTELNICIDSDDYMPDDGVEFIVKVWAERGRGKEGIAGIVGLDYKLDGTPIGGDFVKTEDAHFYEIAKFHFGDTKIVCRTDLLKALEPMPVFEGEKNFNPIYYYMQVDKDNKFLIVNKNFCFVDYQENGMSAAIFYQYRNSPRSFAQLRRLAMSLPYYDLKKNIKDSIHYVSCCLFSHQWNMVKSSPKPWLTILVFPLGCLLNLYVRYRTPKFKNGKRHCCPIEKFK